MIDTLASTIRVETELDNAALKAAYDRYVALDGDDSTEVDSVLAGLKSQIVKHIVDHAPDTTHAYVVHDLLTDRAAAWSSDTEERFFLAWRQVTHLVETGIDPDIGWYGQEGG